MQYDASPGVVRLSFGRHYGDDLIDIHGLSGREPEANAHYCHRFIAYRENRKAHQANELDKFPNIIQSPYERCMNGRMPQRQSRCDSLTSEFGALSFCLSIDDAELKHASVCPLDRHTDLLIVEVFSSFRLSDIPKLASTCHSYPLQMRRQSVLLAFGNDNLGATNHLVRDCLI